MAVRWAGDSGASAGLSDAYVQCVSCVQRRGSHHCSGEVGTTEPHVIILKQNTWTQTHHAHMVEQPIQGETQPDKLTKVKEDSFTPTDRACTGDGYGTRSANAASLTMRAPPRANQRATENATSWIQGTRRPYEVAHHTAP